MGHYSINVGGYYDVEDYLNHNPDLDTLDDEDNIEIDIDSLEEVETLLDDEEE